MSRGHGQLERFILTTLMEREFCSSAYLAETYPSSNGWPTLSIRSSMNRALARLKKQGKIEPFWRGRVCWTLSDSKKSTAFHEAGHAVIARALGVRVKYATIKPGGETAGHVSLYKNFAKS